MNVRIVYCSILAPSGDTTTAHTKTTVVIVVVVVRIVVVGLVDIGWFELFHDCCRAVASAVVAFFAVIVVIVIVVVGMSINRGRNRRECRACRT